MTTLTHRPGTGSLGQGRCHTCGAPWAWNIMRRLWVASCDCNHKKGTTK